MPPTQKKYDLTSISYIDQLSKVTKYTCNLFEEAGFFLSERFGFPSYYSIRGKGHVPIPDNMPLDLKVFPVINETSQDISETARNCEKLARKIFQLKKGFVEVKGRNFMISGSTLPIVVDFSFSNKSSEDVRKESIYVKQMSLNRIFMGLLYHLVQGRHPGFYFSENSVVEPAVKGVDLDSAYYKDHDFLNRQKVKEELVKLTVINYFCSLYDIDNAMNIIFCEDSSFRVIDFDKAFWEPVPSPFEKILNPFTIEIFDLNGHSEIDSLPYDKLARHFSNLEGMVRKEMARVCDNIKNNHGWFTTVVEAMSHIDYYNLAVRELYNKKDITNYFQSRYEEFRIGSSK